MQWRYFSPIHLANAIIILIMQDGINQQCLPKIMSVCISTAPIICSLTCRGDRQNVISAMTFANIRECWQTVGELRQSALFSAGPRLKMSVWWIWAWRTVMRIRRCSYLQYIKMGVYCNSRAVYPHLNILLDCFWENHFTTTCIRLKAIRYAHIPLVRRSDQTYPKYWTKVRQ